jgi:hypothetical protein
MRLQHKTSLLTLAILAIGQRANAGISDEFEIKPAPEPFPAYGATSTDAVLLETPSGKIVFVNSRIEVFDAGASPPTLLATHTVPRMPKPQNTSGDYLRYGVGPCGDQECLIATTIDNGTLIAQRLELDTLTWLDEEPFYLTDSLHETPKPGPSTRRLVWNGDAYMLCSVADVDTATGVLCRSFDESFQALGEQFFASANPTLFSLVSASNSFAVTWAGDDPLGESAATHCDNAQITSPALARTVVLDAASAEPLGAPTRLGLTGGLVTGIQTVPEADGYLSLWRGTGDELCARRVGAQGDAGDTFMSDPGVGTFSATDAGDRGTLVSVAGNPNSKGIDIPVGAESFEDVTTAPYAVLRSLDDGTVIGISDNPGSLQLWSYDQDSAGYAQTGYLPTSIDYPNFIWPLLAHDKKTQTFFAAWFESTTEPSEPLSAPAAQAPGPGPLWSSALRVNLYEPGADSPKNDKPLVIAPGASLGFYDGVEPVIDSTAGVALLAYVAAKPDYTYVLVGQRVAADGTVLDEEAVALDNSANAQALVIGHNSTRLFLSYRGESDWVTLSIDPTTDKLAATALPQGTAIPYGAPVGDALAAVVKTDLGYVESIVDAETLEPRATPDPKTFDPPMNTGAPGYYLVPGTSKFEAVYLSDANTECVAFDSKGKPLSTAPCNVNGVDVGPASNDAVPGPSGLGRVGTTASNGYVLSAWPTGDRNSIEVFAESSEQSQTLTFPGDQRKIEGQVVLQGGDHLALALYPGEWLSNTSESATNLYARWIDVEGDTIVGPSQGAADGDGGVAAGPDGSQDDTAPSADMSSDDADSGTASSASGHENGDAGAVPAGDHEDDAKDDQADAGANAGKPSKGGNNDDSADGGVEANDAGSSSKGDEGSDDSGCGCALPGAQHAGLGHAGWLLAGLGFAARRRRYAK